MKINKKFHFIKEPYTDEKRYWLFDIEEGNVYKINQATFECLENIKERGSAKNQPLISELKKIRAIKDD